MDWLFLVLLILLNAVFALSEMAIVSSRKPRLKAMAERGSRGAKVALRLLEDPSKLLSTVQIGITMIGVGSGAYGANALSGDLAPWIRDTIPAFAEESKAIASGIIIVITTILSLMLGELIPKRIALAAPERLASIVAPPMALLESAVSPVVWLLRFITESFIRLIGLHRTRQEDVTEEEVQALLDEGANVGVIEAEEREMIEGVMRLGDRNVKAIMTPRPEMVWLDPTESQESLLEEITQSKHSRFPVARGDTDQIVGVIQTKELLTNLARNGKIDIEAAMHKPQFVPETMPVLKLLEAMRDNPVRMVFVSDEYGAVLGLVTAADVLESIAGDAALSKEHAISEPVRREDGSWLIDGMMPVDEFEQLLSVKGLDEEEGYTTVAGLVMHLLRAVPNAGDKAERAPLTFEVVDMDGRRVDKVLVTKAPENEDLTG